MPFASLARDLGRLPGVEAVDDPATLESMATDFGQIERRVPAVVARPAGPEAVAALLRYASRQGVPLTARGAGHCQGGQSLSDGGILLDLRGMREVAVTEEGHVRAGAGAEWRQVVEAGLAVGRLPPVLVDHLSVTVAGTLSVAGFGPGSWLHGSQADHCLRLDAVTGEGDRVRCSPDQNAELFRHVLSGFGQLAVITEVECRLRVGRPHTCTVRLEYEEAGGCLRDLRILEEEERVDGLEAWAVPTPAGGRRWLLLATSEVDGPGRGREVAARVLDGLRPNATPRVVGASMRRHLFRRPALPGGPVRAEHPGSAHPWTELLVPRRALEEWLALLLPRLPRAPVLLWPVRRQEPRLPLLRVPADRAVLAAAFTSVAPEELPGALADLRELSERGTELGGFRYPSGWLGFDAEAWRRHLGPSWSQLRQLKRRYDPRGVLNPRLLGFDAVP